MVMLIIIVLVIILDNNSSVFTVEGPSNRKTQVNPRSDNQTPSRDKMAERNYFTAVQRVNRFQSTRLIKEKPHIFSLIQLRLFCVITKPYISVVSGQVWKK
jgi:hypothetical protein